jgi:hypothetical protein
MAKDAPFSTWLIILRARLIRLDGNQFQVQIFHLGEVALQSRCITYPWPGV